MAEQRELVAYTLEDGGEIWVEVALPSPTGMVPAGRGTKAAARVKRSFSKALESLRPAAQAVIDKLRALSDPPDEITVEFGLKLGGKTGAILAASSMEANYKVTLTWKRSEE